MLALFLCAQAATSSVMEDGVPAFMVAWFGGRTELSEESLSVRSIRGLAECAINPSRALVQQADDRYCLARRDPTAARDVHHQRNQAHRVVSTTWTLTCSSSNR